MTAFDQDFDILKLVQNHQLHSLLAGRCDMQWPFFSWVNKDDVVASLEQLVAHCVNIEFISSGENAEHQLTCLYKLTQLQKPQLWCGFWLTTDGKAIQNIRLIFDSFEYIKDDKQIEIFGFKKFIPSHHYPAISAEIADPMVIKIRVLIENYFNHLYNIPIQNTVLAKQRLRMAAIAASTQLKQQNHFTVFLPFFSANERGPIQFRVTITKKPDGSFDLS